MKKTGLCFAAMVPALVFAAVFIGCSSAPKEADAPSPLDQLSPYDYYDPLTGESCTFIFAGDNWSQEVGGVPTLSGALRYEGTRTVLTISRRHNSDPAKWVGVRDGKTIVLEHEADPLNLTIQP